METLENLHTRIEQAEQEHRQKVIDYCEQNGGPPPRELLIQMEHELKRRLLAASQTEQ